MNEKDTQTNVGPQKIVCPHPTDRNFPSWPKFFFYVFFFSSFTILRFLFPEINIFGLQTFQKVYIENRKDIYGDRKVKLDRVKRSNVSIWRERSNIIKIWKKKQTNKQIKIRQTDPTLHRAWKVKQTSFFFWPECMTRPFHLVQKRWWNTMQILSNFFYTGVL